MQRIDVHRATGERPREREAHDKGREPSEKEEHDAKDEGQAKVKSARRGIDEEKLYQWVYWTSADMESLT